MPKMKQYKHIFFDLDKTLWDFEKNSIETFSDIFNNHSLMEKGIPSVDQFMEKYKIHNTYLWDQYRNGLIEKEPLSIKRFVLTLNDFGIIDDDLAKKISFDYITISPKKTNLFPGTHETLEYLKGKYNLHIITNGFREVQIPKLRASDLDKYFINVIVSEEAGSKKPDSGIFNYSLKKANARASESLMIGDDIEVDIIGARNAGIDQVYINYSKLNHEEAISFEINEMKELMNIL